MINHPLMSCPDFRKFFFGRVISAVGDKFYTIALAWWVISSEGNSGILLGILMASNILPVVLFGPVAGTLVDRMNRKTCMIIADIARFFSISIILILYLLDWLSLPLLYILVFCTSMFSPLFEAAANSSLENLTGREKLAQATALNSSVLQLSNIIGATLGGIFLAIAQVQGAMLVNALSYAVSLLFVWNIKTNLRQPERQKKEPYLSQLREGFVYVIKGNRTIGYVLALYAISNFFASSILFFIPLVVKSLYHETVTWVAILEGSMAGGFVVVSLVLSFMQKGGNVYWRSFVGGWVIAGAFTLLVMDNPMIAACGLFCMGVAISWSGSAMQVLYQKSVSNEMKGRFFALMSALVYAGFPLTFLCNGFLLNLFSLKQLLIFNGVAVLIVNFGFLVIPKYQMKDETAYEAVKNKGPIENEKCFKDG
ncbi:MFS transporter [Candidatus Formimonas warabiya]|uniref:Major facilitator superfamily (MFS) profile domain-containing protein n=1 Tax=Formimonas warabiya TaxID=1761012 RepID=A0A3G1KZN4_FORW1|nr:MFS transporter [Candidatus Formimonas warabiya]ATW27858.1 hypothetical protein DCMF_26650 [Candidatus Formimonas warabiya]